MTRRIGISLLLTLPLLVTGIQVILVGRGTFVVVRIVDNRKPLILFVKGFKK